MGKSKDQEQQYVFRRIVNRRLSHLKLLRSKNENDPASQAFVFLLAQSCCVFLRVAQPPDLMRNNLHHQKDRDHHIGTGVKGPGPGNASGFEHAFAKNQSRQGYRYSSCQAVGVPSDPMVQAKVH